MKLEHSPGPVFCLLLGVSSDYAQPITGQVTEVTCPVIGPNTAWAYSKQETANGPRLWIYTYCICLFFCFVLLTFFKFKFYTPGAFTVSCPTRAAILSESFPPSTATPSCCMTSHMAAQASYKAAPSPGNLAAHIQLPLHFTSCEKYQMITGTMIILMGWCKRDVTLVY